MWKSMVSELKVNKEEVWAGACFMGRIRGKDEEGGLNKRKMVKLRVSSQIETVYVNDGAKFQWGEQIQ
jgi:hypothetical protein